MSLEIRIDGSDSSGSPLKPPIDPTVWAVEKQNINQPLARPSPILGCNCSGPWLTCLG